MRSLILLVLLFTTGRVFAEGIQTPYLTMQGRDGEFTGLRLDGGGKSKYGRNLIQSFSLNGMKKMPPTAEGRGWVEYAGVEPVAETQRSQVIKRAHKPVRLEDGRTLGQSFTAEKPFSYVGGCYPTWCNGDSGFTISLRRDGPNGVLVGKRILRNIQDNAWAGLEIEPQPPGRYYFEISDPVGTPGWYTHDQDVYAGGQAYVNGEPTRNADRSLELNTARVVKGTWRISVERNKIKSTFTADPGADKQGLNLRIDLPWILAGYNVTDPKIPFRRFYSDGGQYLPIEHFKRQYGMHMGGKWIHATGRSGADVRFVPGGGAIRWQMSQDTMSLTMAANSEIEVFPQESPLPDYYPVFFSSDPRLDRATNPLYWERAFMTSANHSPAWMPWMALQHYWNNHPNTPNSGKYLESYPVRDDGYVHSWYNLEGWPFPGGCPELDHRQFYTNSNYIIACATYYLWTGDRGFLSKVRDKLRRACDFMLDSPDTNGAEGLLRLTSKDHDGTGKGLAGSYWDNIPFGYLTAYENVYFYASLDSMATLEGVWGNTKRAQELTALREKCRTRYNELFWNDKAGRYIDCIDVNGVKHDHGFTFLNLEAATYGLPSRTQGRRMFHWLDDEPNASGKVDTYSAFVFGPRSNTIDTQGWWFMGGKIAPAFQPYGTHNQQGGAIMYVSFFDLMARKEFLGIDNAMKRLREILARYEMPDKLCGGTPLYRGEADGSQVGTSIPFPESGLVPTFWVHGLLGLKATPSGLEISPSLPRNLTFAGVKHLWFHGKPVTIKAFRDRVEVTREDTGRMRILPLRPGKPVLYTQPSY